ncbi:hypothetical protein ACF05W_34750 [Streptomyces lydicus]|uniref:hypothetical protein n=1 Tax=Streptomyces lydicus TaxID=47763 RepID=UPI003700728A
MHFGVTTLLDNAPAARSGHFPAPPDRPHAAAELALPAVELGCAGPPASAAVEAAR